MYWAVTTAVAVVVWLLVDGVLSTLWPDWGLRVSSKGLSNREYVASIVAALAWCAVGLPWAKRIAGRQGRS